MRFYVRAAVWAVILVGIYILYQQPILRPQFDELRQRFLTLVRQAEDSINEQISFGPNSGLGSRNISVVVPRSRYLDWQQVGMMGQAILAKDPVTLRVEVDFTPKSKPEPADIDLIRAVLSRYSDKTPQIYLDTSNLPVQSDYSLDQVITMTEDNRGCYSNSQQTCLYLLFLPGTLEHSNALGASYAATDALFLTDQMSGAGGPLVSRNRIAQATITHELGHLFGLVNLVYHSSRNHEDPSHPGHSKNPGSVMYWAVEDISIGSVIAGGPPTSFDGDDEFDISQIRSGAK
jgi:hypothetical protein